jgi:hypothetical protein
MNEEDQVSHRRGKWSQEGVPHKGWTCIDIEDLGEPGMICEMCESQVIRYVHLMEHTGYSGVLRVGCVCAGHMEGDLGNAKVRDDFMKSRARKRSHWLSRKWKLSVKGNEYLKADGFIITVFMKVGSWSAHVKSEDGRFERFSTKRYSSQETAKLATFNFVSKLLAEQEGIK